MDQKAIFKLSYGLFLAGVQTENVKNACIINTAMQITAEPLRAIVTLQKANYTHDLILEKGSLAISILKEDCDLQMIERFGMHSGRDRDKFEQIDCETDENGNPFLAALSCAVLSLKVFDTRDLGTHTMFFCDIADARALSDAAPLTYDLYRRRKNGEAVQKAAEKTAPGGDWVCSICHYKYDGEIPFEELPDDWVCPVCKRGKDVFVRM